jgi:outer membrane lipoprotein-sorting protein
MILVDRLGQTTRLAFERIERNPRLPDESFRFTPPPGVDVIGRAPAGDD